ncbi:hypothetical protein [Ottowia testudinis]|uniref:HNH/ENDO VII superfamily nuclease n=1 Tax=Ottowia testudinis TaxID=2816950 RepID=A0A975CJD9_9BURK|nr:hypothetical protein [Ottowia testudinis]QTD46072.1 hypothetical protein J1M35_03945 [Ottowia testudinis]
MSIPLSSPLGRAGAAAAQTAAHGLSPAAREALAGATTLGAVNPTQLAQHIQRLPDAAARRQVMDELAPQLPPRDLQDVQRQLGQPPAKPKGIDAGLALDLTQIGLDVAGIFDPTPISDGANTLISLGRGDWLGAGLSAVSMIPYVGDAAKLGKLGKYAQTVAKAIDAARANPALRQALAPAVKSIGDAIAKLPLDKLPESARKQITTLKELTGIFAKESDAATRPALKAAGDLPTAATARAAGRVGAQPAWGKYLNDIKAQTGLAVTPKQQKLIDAHLAKTDHTRLSVADSKAHRADFNRVKNELITQWEKQTGQSWPRYAEDLYSKNGTLVRRAGQPYDAHHIIESSYGGPNQWWNMHPARFPDQHQQGIHRAGGPSSQIFS